MMNINKIFYHFDHFEGRFPTQALAVALAQQEALTPHLLTILETVVSQPTQVAFDQMDYMFALYLLSKFREIKAFPLIIALATLPGEIPENLLGDCITESLARFIVSTFDGNLMLIKNLIENEHVNEWSRNVGLKSLLGLIALNKLQREEVIEYVRTLFHSQLANDEDFATHLVNIAGVLYPEELLPEINQAFKDDKMNTWSVDQDWINQMLAQGKDQCLLDHVYKDHFHLPIDDIEKDMSWMQCFHLHCTHNHSHHEEDENLDDYESIATYIRNTAKTGRNEICPCGSGKKFKKCCIDVKLLQE
jgi:Protein of unknown function (DUF1186)/SEC-C motif